MYKIAIAEDHKYMRNYLSSICEALGLVLLFIAEDGQELEDYLFATKSNPAMLPDIILMDICMPVLNGIAATAFVTRHFPSIKVLALSLYAHEKPIIDMLKSGAKGFIDKANLDSTELRLAINTVMNNELYISSPVLKEWQILPNYLKANYHKNYKTYLLSDREYEFLSYCGIDLDYKEIADKMNVKISTVNNFRAAVSEKLNIHSRPGLTAYAIWHGLSQIYHPESFMV